MKLALVIIPFWGFASLAFMLALAFLASRPTPPTQAPEPDSGIRCSSSDNFERTEPNCEGPASGSEVLA